MANTRIKNSKVKIQLLSKGKVIKEKEVFPIKLENKEEDEWGLWTISDSISNIKNDED